MQKIESFDSLAIHVAENHGMYAKSSLEAYFYKHAFTGSSFERFQSKNECEFTAEDLIAVKMLSVEVPASAARWILTDGRDTLTPLLRKIKFTISIEHDDADLTKGSHAWQLWKALFDRHGVGETICSKLLAAKRPLLFPIYDQHVAAALGLSPNYYWEPWQSFMRSEVGRNTAKRVRAMADEIGRSDVSTLRLLDIIVWMQRHGHSFIKQKLVDQNLMTPVNYADPR